MQELQLGDYLICDTSPSSYAPSSKDDRTIFAHPPQYSRPITMSNAIAPSAFRVILYASVMPVISLMFIPASGRSANLQGVDLSYADIAGVPLTGCHADRLQALLAFILLHHDRPQSRQQIAVNLWPEATDAETKANLRRRLPELKQIIPETDRWLQIETKTIQWVIDQTCHLDVAQFETAIAQEQSQAS